MRLRQIKEILDAEIFCGEELLNQEIHSAFAGDFMSDVLAFVKEQDLLITGMVNPQVVRTAELMDMKCIVFVRGKTPDKATVDMARERGIIVMATHWRMYATSGLLYTAGLGG